MPCLNTLRADAIEIDKTKFEKSGYNILRGALTQRIIKQIQSELLYILRDQMKKFGHTQLDGHITLNDYVRLAFVKGSIQREFLYNFLRHIPTVRALATSEFFQEILKKLDFLMPIALEFPSIRFDIPGETEFLTRPHQDLRSVRSERCATIWFPLTRVNETNGTILIYPGTHRFGLLEHKLEERQLKVCDLDLLGESLIVEANPGDIVILNSLCVHFSVPGQTDSIKINGQVVWNDAALVDSKDKFWQLNRLPDTKEL